MKISTGLLLASASLLATPAVAQLGLPPLGQATPRVGDVLDTARRTLDPLDSTLGSAAQVASQLADARVRRLADLVRRNRDVLELDRSGNPARRGELILADPSAAAIATAEAAGFAVAERERLDTLGITLVRLRTPERRSLSDAEGQLRRLLPDTQISADTLHFQSGAAAGDRTGTASARQPSAINAEIGVIDGAPGAQVGRQGGATVTRGFARGAPRPSQHGSAVVSLLAWAGARRIAVADVYGDDPAGGNALAIARALDWLAGRSCRVVTISLVGPNNPMLARAIAAAQRRGMQVVAAVGNDGPAAPPAYPASYPGVIAVTGVDGRNRALIEAGRAEHVDYAAPAADLLAANAQGKWVRVRGTSYAAPLVAARAAAAAGSPEAVIKALDREAIDLGRKGPDPVYGRGLLCADCARRK